MKLFVVLFMLIVVSNPKARETAIEAVDTENLRVCANLRNFGQIYASLCDFTRVGMNLYKWESMDLMSAYKSQVSMYQVLKRICLTLNESS